MKRTAIVILGLVLVGIVPTDAHSPYRENRYTLIGSESDRWDRDSHVISVRLHQSLLEMCSGPPQSCSTTNPDTARDQIQRAVMTALADFNSAGADVRLVVSGWTSSADRRPNAIVVAHYSALFNGACDLQTRAMAAHQAVYASNGWFVGRYSSGMMLFCTEHADARLRWTPWDENFRSGEALGAFIPTFKHELLHVLGLDHPTGVDTDAMNTTVMRPVLLLFKHLAREDIRFLRDHFGPRENDPDVNVSSNGTTWTATTASAPPDASRTIGRVAASNSGGASNLYLAWRGSSENHIAVTRYTPGASWATMAFVPSTNAPYSPGLAAANNQDLILVTQRHSTGSYPLRPAVRVSADGGVTWTSEYVLPGFTSIPGVSATYDPASGDWLIFTGRDGRIQYFSLRAGDQLDELSETWRTADVPSAACGPVTETDPYNCLVAWQSDGWEAIVHWTQCRVVLTISDTKLECLPRRNLSYLTVSSPTVTYAGASGSYPWQIALTQGGTGIYTWRKAGSGSASWSDQRSFFYAAEAGRPVLGSQLRSGVNRVFLGAFAAK